jgi:3-oxoacyl-[acyl-carrier protein] reductase
MVFTMNPVNITTEKFLSEKTVLITGALGGIGSEIVDAFSKAGAQIVLHHLNQPKDADEVVERLRQSETSAIAISADVASWSEVEEMVKQAEGHFGGIDILINNAGFMAPAAFVEMTQLQWEQTISVDLTGVFITSRHVVPGMLARGNGTIINISSQLAFKGAKDYTSYCAAKAGVVGLTRAMARELGPAIRINAVAPGPVNTPFIAPWATASWVEERTRDLVSGRLAEASEIAPAILFLASPAAALFHGQTLHINGGGVMA